MKSTYLYCSIIVISLFLTACSAPLKTNTSGECEQVFTAQSSPADYHIIPMDDLSRSISVPDFLDAQQQDLYRHTYSLYMHLFGGDTSMVEYIDISGTNESPTVSPETVEYNGITYQVARGTFQKWADFDAAVHSVFTDSFWVFKNKDNIFVEQDEKLCFLSAARGSGYYYNPYFPDEFQLIEKTDTSISFTLIGHYSPSWIQDGESSLDRDNRLLEGYDYTLEFPIKLVLTENGWRFDEFYSALADEKEQID